MRKVKQKKPPKVEVVVHPHLPRPAVQPKPIVREIETYHPRHGWIKRRVIE